MSKDAVIITHPATLPDPWVALRERQYREEITLLLAEMSMLELAPLYRLIQQKFLRQKGPEMVAFPAGNAKEA